MMVKKMETTMMGYIGFYTGYIGIMENKMEITIVGGYDYCYYYYSQRGIQSDTVDTKTLHDLSLL